MHMALKDIRIIDLHCDTLTACHGMGRTPAQGAGHLSPSRVPAGFRLCQAMAVFMPDTLRGAAALDYFKDVRDLFEKSVQDGELHAVRDCRDIEQALADNTFAAVLTVEGGSALAGELGNLALLRKAGVRMMTLTWNAENELCGGVATDMGFTALGRQVVAEMEQTGIAVDASHLSDQSFWELCELAQRPFLASHSCARAVCSHRRNLTDDMFREIAGRGGVVGINYYTAFLREDGTPETTSVQDIIRHVHHFLALDGEDVVALGSDFDGADMPQDINGVEKLGYLYESMQRSGLSDAVLEKIFFENARRYLAGLKSWEEN